MLKNNILANLFGNGLTAIVFILSIPIYVKYLGVEAYGLVGIFASLQIIFSVLDMGLSATLNREFARLSIQTNGASEQKELLRTFEYIYVAIALLIGLIITLCAPLISRHWISANTVPVKVVQFVIMQMGVLLALRWPMALYAGGLAGLQQQVLYNVINTCAEIVKAVGAIFVLAFFSNSIITFFYWQISITAITVVILNLVLWKRIPFSASKPFFNRALLIKNKTFAAGMGATSLAVIILTQTDKIILSKLLDLKTFAYFTLASAIASSLYRIIIPISQAVYPKLVQLAQSPHEIGIVRTFHMACQIIAVIVLPASFTICFFSEQIILLWTRDIVITAQVYPLVQVLIIGTACNALVTIPYMTQLAFGWTKLGLYQNIIAITILIPSVIYLTGLYGAMGAAIVWTILNACYIIFSMPVMFSRILKTEMVNWYKNDILILTMASFASIGLSKVFFNYFNISGNFWVILFCFFSFLSGLIITSLTAHHTRDFVFKQYRRIFGINSHG